MNWPLIFALTTILAGAFALAIGHYREFQREQTRMGTASDDFMNDRDQPLDQRQ